MRGITLILEWKTLRLWVETDTSIASIWGVIGLQLVKDPFSTNDRVGILQNGKQIGNLWEVKEIKERW